MPIKLGLDKVAKDILHLGRDGVKAVDFKLEVSKLERKIAKKQNIIAENKQRIGDYYYKKFHAENNADDAIMHYCQLIAEANSNIENTQAKIDTMKDRK